MKSTITFERFYKESMTSGSALGDASVGFSPDGPFSKDTYATGNQQIPKGGGVLTRRGKHYKTVEDRKRTKKKKRRK